MRMPVLVATAALIPLLATVPATASAQQKSSSSSSDMAVSFRFGTQGLGLELAKLVTPHIGLRVGYEFFSDSINQSSSGVEYGVGAKLHSFNGLLDLYPGARGSFHFTAGVVTNPLEAKGSGVATNGTITLNGHQYSGSDVGTLSADAKFSSLAPYIGIGTGTAANHGGGVFFLFDLGARIGKPTFSLTTSNTGNATLVSDVNAQQAKTQTNFNKVPVYPVLSFGLGYRF